MYLPLRYSCLGKLSRNNLMAAMAVAALLLMGAPNLRAATLCVNPAGHGCSTTITQAVNAAAPGDTIEVAQGTYNEDVHITKPLSLVAMDHAKPVIDATNKANGIFIDGMADAPNTGISNIVVSGFEIMNANFEGILVANASDVTLVNNYVHDNDRALDISAKTCTGIPAFETMEGEDCGEGIHLLGSNNVTVLHNDVAYNAGGILTSDDTGPAYNNLIEDNHVHDNPYDCGITLASHLPASIAPPTAPMFWGVWDNTIAHNVSSHNGYEVPGGGAGVGIFAPFPGATDKGNVVIDNVITNNGQSGVAMHNHPPFPGYPFPDSPVNMNDNKFIGNVFSGNGPDSNDGGKPTGINIYSTKPVMGTVVSQNKFKQEGIDTAFDLPGSQVVEHFNEFGPNSVGVDNFSADSSSSVDATENWWNCSAGPGASGCASAAGSNVMVMPWLTAPLAPGQNLH